MYLFLTLPVTYIEIKIQHGLNLIVSPREQSKGLSV
jgi:hypothetical protein